MKNHVRLSTAFIIQLRFLSSTGFFLLSENSVMWSNISFSMSAVMKKRSAQGYQVKFRPYFFSRVIHVAFLMWIIGVHFQVYYT